MGPGTKFPTLGHISYAEFRDAYEEQALGLLEGGVDLLLIETQFDMLSVKAAINGAAACHGRSRPPRAPAGAGDDRAHRPHAARHRDRRRPDRARLHAGRRGRPQLRHRTGRDERGAAPPLGGQPRPHRLRPQCGPPIGRRRQHALRPHARRPGGAPAPFRDRVRRHRRRWVLWNHPGPPGCRGRALPRGHARGADAGARARGGLHLHLGPVPTGHVVPRRRRAHQRQRLQGVPRGDARRRLGHLRRPWPATRSRRART